MSNINDILRSVLEKIKPKDYERKKIEKVTSRIINKIKLIAKELNVPIEARVEGSIAKDTWISGDRDIDIFIRLPKKLGLEGLKEIGLEIARRAAETNWVECYAEHPYIEAEIDGFKIDLVPCFMIKNPSEVASTVDRTPFHTEYIKSHLKDELKDEVRLLKQFMKGINVYGAEIKIQGFSGYLCELLVLYYGSFINVVKAAAFKWKPYSVVIDIEKYYDKIEDAKLIFNAPLIVVDPVDRSRNVAAALSLQKMCEFIVASKFFLKNPSMKFFFPPKIAPLSFNELINKLHERGTDLLFIVTKCPKVHPDILWGQLYKSKNGIEKLLNSFNFKVISSAVWSDELKHVIFIYELESAKLPLAEKHLGPPVYSTFHSERFLRKHLSSKNIIAGPSIEGDRWIIYIKRKYNNAIQLIKEKIMSARLGSLIKQCLSKNSFNILINDEIKEYYENLPEFAIFMTKFMVKKLIWLN